jgi:hypothetical protein
MGAQHKGSARYNSTSCLPSAVLDEGIDPSAVDYRNFFPYIPNEVKHRKRTSNDQAKVLEGVFDRNTKPDSALRQRLAKELNMTPRGVQVRLRTSHLPATFDLGACRFGFRIGKLVPVNIFTCCSCLLSDVLKKS